MTLKDPASQCRKAFEQTLIVLDQLIGVFEAAGPDRPVDIDNAAQRESLDVIGRVGKGFRHLGASVITAPLNSLHQGVRSTANPVPCSYRIQHRLSGGHINDQQVWGQQGP